jgi:hypothetical protein
MLPNPNTPMAYLPPEAAKAMTMQTYVTIGSLAVSLFLSKRDQRIISIMQALVWDLLLHLHEDYRLITQHRINITFVIYCITR